MLNLFSFENRMPFGPYLITAGIIIKVFNIINLLDANLSNNIAEQAADTFNEFILPCIGIVAMKSEFLSVNCLIPFSSLPSIIPIYLCSQFDPIYLL